MTDYATDRWKVKGSLRIKWLITEVLIELFEEADLIDRAVGPISPGNCLSRAAKNIRHKYEQELKGERAATS